MASNVCVFENDDCQSLAYLKKTAFIDLDDLSLPELECLKY